MLYFVDPEEVISKKFSKWKITFALKLFLHFKMNFPLLFSISKVKEREDTVHEVDEAGQDGHGSHAISSMFALRIKSH